MFALRTAPRSSSLASGLSTPWRASTTNPRPRAPIGASHVLSAGKKSTPDGVDPPYTFARSKRYLATVSPTDKAVLANSNTDDTRRITFVDKAGVSHTCRVADGASLLDIAKARGLEVEGACGGDCACSTCHVIVTSPSMYDTIVAPTERENDMLDMAFEVTETSRLGCQVKVDRDLEGLEVKLPGITRDLHAG